MIAPYARGDKSHQEFARSKVRFDAERAVAGVPGYSGLWLAGYNFRWRISAMPLTSCDYISFNFSFCGRSDDMQQHGTMVQTRHGYKEGIDDRIDASYLILMKEKGAEVRSRVKMIVASAWGRSRGVRNLCMS